MRRFLLVSLEGNDSFAEAFECGLGLIDDALLNTFPPSTQHWSAENNTGRATLKFTVQPRQFLEKNAEEQPLGKHTIGVLQSSAGGDGV